MASISPAPAKCSKPSIFSALKYLSAIKPIINGAMIAPNDCVENAVAIWVPVAFRLAPRNVPRVTNHDPHMKNSRNIMKERRKRIPVLINFDG